MGERSALRHRVAERLVAVASIDETIEARDADELLGVIRARRPSAVVIDQRHAAA